MQAAIGADISSQTAASTVVKQTAVGYVILLLHHCSIDMLICFNLQLVCLLKGAGAGSGPGLPTFAGLCWLCFITVLTKAVVVQAALRDKLLQDHSVLAAFLTGLRMYLEDPTKVTHLTFQGCFARLLMVPTCSSAQISDTWTFVCVVVY